MKNEKSHDRANGQTAISFSCSVKMKKELAKRAFAENRTLSNYLQTVLTEFLKTGKTA